MADVNWQLYVMSSAGVVEWLGSMDHYTLGMAYVPDPDSAPFFRQYGYGCLTQAGQVPWMLGGGCPQGGQTMTIEVRNAVPNITGLLAFGVGDSSAPVPTPACQLQMLPLAAVVPMTTDSSGDVTYPISIPNGLGMKDVWFQAGFVDMMNPTTVVLTNPLRVHVQ